MIQNQNKNNERKEDNVALKEISKIHSRNAINTVYQYTGHILSKSVKTYLHWKADTLKFIDKVRNNPTLKDAQIEEMLTNTIRTETLSKDIQQKIDAREDKTYIVTVERLFAEIEIIFKPNDIFADLVRYFNEIGPKPVKALNNIYYQNAKDVYDYINDFVIEINSLKSKVKRSILESNPFGMTIVLQKIQDMLCTQQIQQLQLLQTTKDEFNISFDDYESVEQIKPLLKAIDDQIFVTHGKDAKFALNVKQHMAALAARDGYTHIGTRVGHEVNYYNTRGRGRGRTRSRGRGRRGRGYSSNSRGRGLQRSKGYFGYNSRGRGYQSNSPTSGRQSNFSRGRNNFRARGFRGGRRRGRGRGRGQYTNDNLPQKPSNRPTGKVYTKEELVNPRLQKLVPPGKTTQVLKQQYLDKDTINHLSNVPIEVFVKKGPCYFQYRDGTKCLRHSHDKWIHAFFSFKKGNRRNQNWINKYNQAFQKMYGYAPDNTSTNYNYNNNNKNNYNVYAVQQDETQNDTQQGNNTQDINKDNNAIDPIQQRNQQLLNQKQNIQQKKQRQKNKRKRFNRRKQTQTNTNNNNNSQVNQQ